MTLTAERLREVLDYDPLTGVFVWAVTLSNRAKAGQTTGCSDGRGYLLIRVDGRLYRAHRLAWLWSYGDWPAGEIDHADMVRSNNRLSNLRDATRTQNNANRRPISEKLKGVTHRSERGVFKAQIKISRRGYHLGHFDTAEEAHAAYAFAAKKLFREFARTE